MIVVYILYWAFCFLEAIGILISKCFVVLDALLLSSPHRETAKIDSVLCFERYRFKLVVDGKEEYTCLDYDMTIQ